MAIAVILTSILLAKVGGCTGIGKPADGTRSGEVSEPQTVQETVEEQEPSAEEAFADFINDIINNADEYDGDHPVYIDDNGIDRVTWEKYAIDDFVGDGKPTLLVLRSYFRLGDGLTVYQYENGKVTEKRTTWFMGDLEYTTFYTNAIAWVSYGTAYDKEYSVQFCFLDDRYLSDFGIKEKSYIDFRHDDQGNIWYSKGPGWEEDADEVLITEDEYSDYITKLTRDESYASYWMLSPEFKDITR